MYDTELWYALQHSHLVICLANYIESEVLICWYVVWFSNTNITFYFCLLSILPQVPLWRNTEWQNKKILLTHFYNESFYTIQLSSYLEFMFMTNPPSLTHSFHHSFHSRFVIVQSYSCCSSLSYGCNNFHSLLL